jgi:hypothetical protein
MCPIQYQSLLVFWVLCDNIYDDCVFRTVSVVMLLKYTKP